MPNLTKPVLIQGDRAIFPEDIDHIRTILRQFPGLSRHEVTETLCEHLNWLTPAGLPKTTAPVPSCSIDSRSKSSFACRGSREEPLTLAVVRKACPGRPG